MKPHQPTHAPRFTRRSSDFLWAVVLFLWLLGSLGVATIDPRAGVAFFVLIATLICIFERKQQPKGNKL